MPRPSYLTRALVERITQLLRVGVPSETAAGAVGLDGSTFFLWLKKGRDGEPGPIAGSADGQPTISYIEFFEAVMRARSEAQVRAIGAVVAAAQSDWRAAAWYLERTSAQWMQKSKVTNVQTGDPDAPVVMATPDEARELLRQRLTEAVRQRRGS